MSYRLDLDEQPEERLLAELVRRRALRKKGLCDYCERAPDTKPCKFPGRHHRAQEKKTDEDLS